MGEIVIEPITPADGDGVAELYRRHGYGPGKYAPRMEGAGFARVLAERGTRLFLVARQNGRVVGTCGFFRMSGQRVCEPRELFAGLFFVEPSLRSGPLAGRLFSGAILPLIEAGVESLRVEVDPSNQQALPLYRRVGFRALGESRTDEEGYVELVSHLPRLLIELNRRFPEQARNRIDVGAGWRGMSEIPEEMPDIETVQGQEVIRYEFHFNDIHIRSFMDPDSGDILDLAVTLPGELPPPRLSRTCTQPRTGVPEAIHRGSLILELDPLNGVLSLYHRAHLGPLVVDPWPSAGPPFLAGWRRQPDRGLQVSQNESGWTVREEREDGVALCRASRLTSEGVEHTVWWEGSPAGVVLAAPWCTARQLQLWTTAGYRPAAIGRYPSYLMDFEGLAETTPEPVGDSEPSEKKNPIWWDAASGLSVTPYHRGSVRERYTMGYLPALEWYGKGPLEHGYRVAEAHPPFPTSDPDESDDVMLARADLPHPGTGSLVAAPAQGVEFRERTLARERVTVLGHDHEEYILSGTAGGVVAWRSGGTDVLATPYPRVRAFGANPRWRSGLWACRQPGREDPEFGLGWGQDDTLSWRIAEPDALTADGLEVRLRPARLMSGSTAVEGNAAWLLAQLTENSSGQAPAEDLVLYLTPKTPRGGSVLVPGVPGHVWGLATTSSWRCWAGRAAVALFDDRWLLVAPQRAEFGEVLVRSTPDGPQLGLVARSRPLGSPTTWLLGVVSDRFAVESHLAGEPARHRPGPWAEQSTSSPRRPVNA